MKARIILHLISFPPFLYNLFHIHLLYYYYYYYYYYYCCSCCCCSVFKTRLRPLASYSRPALFNGDYKP